MGSRLRRYEDPEHGRDPRLRSIVAHLRMVELPGPEANFRAELRTQLVAVAPSLIADGAAEDRSRQQTRAAKTREPKTHRDVTRSADPVRKHRFARPLAIAATFVTVCALLLGGAVWQSRKALPGDALYGLKRASENVQLYLDTNDTEKATDYLHFSQTRVAEAQALLNRASASGTGLSAGGVSAGVVTELNATLDTADRQLTAGWNLLNDQAQSSRSSKPYSIMEDWAPGQIRRLKVLAKAMPTKALKTRAIRSKTAAGGAYDLAQSNAAKLNHPSPSTPPGQQTGGNGTSQPTPSGRGGTGSTARRTEATTKHGGTTTKPTHRSAQPSTARPSGAGSTAARTKASATKPLLRLLPTQLPDHLPGHLLKTPLVSSCSVSVVGVHLGRCSHS